MCQKLSEAQFVANLEHTAANLVLVGLARSKRSFVVVEYTGIGNLTARKSYHLELSQIIKNGWVFVLTKYIIRTKIIKRIYKHGVLCFIGLKLELSILKQNQFLLVKRPNNNRKLLDSKEITFSQFNMRAIWCSKRLTVSIFACISERLDYDHPDILIFMEYKNGPHAVKNKALNER